MSSAMSQMMHEWQPQAFTYLLQKDYASAASIYEQAIADEPEVISHYFYLGLLQLLQGEETEAQFTWMECINEETAIEQVDILTSKLVSVLYTELLRQKEASEYETAWLISQHIHEIAPSNLNNSLILVWLCVELERIAPDDLVLLEVIETLKQKAVGDRTEASYNSFDHNLLWELLSNLLKHEPMPPLFEFVEACLPFVQEPKPFIYNLIRASVEFAYNQQKDKVAICLLKLCLKLSPEHLEVFEHLGRIYLKIRIHDEALESARTYSRLAQKLIDKVFANTLLLGVLLTKGGHWQEALDVFCQQEHLFTSLIAENPTELSQPVITRLYICNYYNSYIKDQPRLYRILQNQIAELCQTLTNVDLTEQIQRFRQRSLSRDSSQKLKIGYISKFMVSHSVGWLARWLIKHHDRDQFELYGYFLGYREYPDDLQAWYESQMDYVYRVDMDGIQDYTTIVARIHKDEIDILIDLDSATFDISCAVMALKPAPIEITWLGSDASGIPTIDYFMADDYVLPDYAQEYYTEKIWRLPQTYIAVDGFEVGIPSLRRDQLDVPPDAVLYFSGQPAFKRHPDNVHLQMQIIKAVPNSYFLIKGFGDQKAVKEFFEEIAIAEGVNPEQLRFLPMTSTEAEHRANLAIADIVLDTFPYNGATTTLETLWMCIPIVTKVGEQFAARNSYTMMMNAGISEGIAWTDAEYVEWGIRLGTDAALREDIATRLKASRQTSPLWNGEKFTREMENAYQQMWQLYTQRN
jgi:predicted O-linked N-acetylglucosamine transferase (SPINDLY family)